MRTSKTVCDLCGEDVSEFYYLIHRYSDPKKSWIKIFSKNSKDIKELDVCENCMRKIVNNLDLLEHKES